MQILSIKEFDAQCSAIDSLKKVYQGKTLVGGPVFPLTDIQAAQSYCKIFSSQQAEKICLIVEDKNFLRIWTETEETADSDNDLLSSKNQNVSERTPIDIEFTNNCQKLLAQYIGPIAQIVCKKTLAKKPNLTRKKFVDLLAKQISNSQQAREFKQRILK